MSGPIKDFKGYLDSLVVPPGESLVNTVFLNPPPGYTGNAAVQMLYNVTGGLNQDPSVIQRYIAQEEAQERAAQMAIDLANAPVKAEVLAKITPDFIDGIVKDEVQWRDFVDKVTGSSFSLTDKVDVLRAATIPDNQIKQILGVDVLPGSGIPVWALALGAYLLLRR